MWHKLCRSFHPWCPGVKTRCLSSNVISTPLVEQHDDVMTWNSFPHYRPFVKGIHRSPVDFLHKDTLMRTFDVSLKLAWTNCWTNSRIADDLRRHDIQVTSQFNTLRPRQNGRHFADDIFKCIFLNENVWIPIKISLKFVPKGQINKIPALVQIMAWRRPGDKPLSEPMVVIVYSPYYRPFPSVNGQGASDAELWRFRCCLSDQAVDKQWRYRWFDIKYHSCEVTAVIYTYVRTTES